MGKLTLHSGCVLPGAESLLYSNGDWRGTAGIGGEQAVLIDTGNRLTPEGHEPERFESEGRKNKTGGNQHKKGACDRPSVLPVCWRAAVTDLRGHSQH